MNSFPSSSCSLSLLPTHLLPRSQVRLRGVAQLFREAVPAGRCGLRRTPAGGFVAAAELDLARVTFFIEV
jgi:hypothetical protein